MANEPHRLIELRRRKQLSRQALAREANVSERQLARIETGRVRVRNSTLERLAKALDVAPEVIAGTQPLPEAHNEVPALEIDAGNLKALRKGKRLSRAALADKAGVSERQLARLESPDSTRKAVRATTIRRIAKALDADEKKLSGASPVPSKHAPREHGRVGFRVSTELRLAFDLIRFHYGPTPRQVIELAPLLFVLLAEGSLAWRKERVAEIERITQRLHELGNDSQLYFAHRVEYVEDGLEHEKGSIMNADVLGDDVRRENEDIAACDAKPFAAYLRKMADDLGAEGTVDFDRSDFAVGWFSPIWGAEPYAVCGDILGELTGGSKYALWALVHGDAQLSEIPEDLLKPEAKDDRVAWLESKLSDDVRDREDAAEARAKEFLKPLLTIDPKEGGSDTQAARPAGETW